MQPRQGTAYHRKLMSKRTGLKPKDLMMLPARVALALQADGWWLRSEIVWAKPNPMPESVRDRPTSSHEKVFLLTKRPTYYYDADAVRTLANPESVRTDPGRNSSYIWFKRQTLCHEERART